MKKAFNLLLVNIFILSAVESFSQVRIMAGFKDATYYRMTKDISAITELKIDILPSAGSMQNFKALMKDACDLAFLQYDVIFFQLGLNADDQAKIDNLKIVLPLGMEEIHLITLKSNDFKGIDDLEGKKVAIGSKNQGTYITASYIKSVTKIKWKSIALGFNDALEALLVGDVAAFFFVGSAPVNKLYDLPQNIQSKLTLIPLTHPKLQEYYTPVTLKSGTYQWLKEDIATYGVRYALATNTKAETSAEYDNIKKLVEDIRTKYDVLVQNGHEQWKEVDFKFDNIKWPIHSATMEIFNLKRF